MFSLANIIVFCKYEQILICNIPKKKLGQRPNKSEKIIQIRLPNYFETVHNEWAGELVIVEGIKFGCKNAF